MGLVSPRLLTVGSASGGGGGGGGSSYSSAVLTDTPAAYWRLGDASGTTMADSSGNSRSGTYVGSPTLGVAGLVSGDTDTAVTFNGSTQYATVPNGSWMNTSTALTCEAIVKTSNTGTISIIDRDNTTRHFQFRMNSGKLEFIVLFGGINTLTGATTISNGVKHHVAATYDGTTMRIYVDGASDGTLARSGVIGSSTDGLTVAANTGGAFQRFNGTLDECAYYTTVLSSTRIAAHAALI